MTLHQMRHTKLWLAGQAENWELAAYDALAAGCNNCHQATNFGFNRVQRPETNPYPNQVFSPK